MPTIGTIVHQVHMEERMTAQNTDRHLCSCGKCDYTPAPTYTHTHTQLGQYGLKWTVCVGTPEHRPPHLTKSGGHTNQDGISPLVGP